MQRMRETVHALLHSEWQVCSVVGVTSDYNVEIPGQLAPDSWFGVSGGALPYRIEVQVGLSAGRPVLLGLRVEEVGEVSARQLRTIRVPEIDRKSVV